MSKSFTTQQLSEYASNDDHSCLIAIHGHVYDLQSFLSEHPGGKKVLLKVKGTDASKQFDQFHARSVLDKYGPRLKVGVLTDDERASTQDTTQVSDHGPFGDLIPYGDPAWYLDAPSPYYSDSHRLVRRLTRAFVDQHITPYCHEWDEQKHVPRELYKLCAKEGLLAAMVGTVAVKSGDYHGPLIGGLRPEQFDNFHEFIVCDELARCGSGGVLWAIIGGLGIGLPPVAMFGSAEMRHRVIPECLSGEKCIALAITEPTAGSDVANLKCEARLDGDCFVVNGEKKWITNGQWADYFTVAVRTGGAGMGGISLLLIERSMPGVSTRHMQCSGVWASGTAYVTFEDVRVPKSNLIGRMNSGFKYIMSNFNHERMGIAIQATRFARVCYEESVKYAHKRKTFGKRLIDHAVIRNKLAHMIRQVEATHAWMESLIYQTIHMPHDEQMLRLGGAIALLKAQSTQTFEYCAREAAQIFGGLAYSRGGQGEKVERLYREVRAYAIPGGAEEIMLELGVKQSLKVGELMGAKL